jgi:hypothetical protein
MMPPLWWGCRHGFPSVFDPYSYGHNAMGIPSPLKLEKIVSRGAVFLDTRVVCLAIADHIYLSD